MASFRPSSSDLGSAAAPHCHYPLLTLLCKGRLTAKSVNFFFSSRFCDDHRCGDRQPDGRSASTVEGKPHRARRYRQRPRRGGSDLARASKSGSFPRPISASTCSRPGRREVGARESAEPFIVIAYDADGRAAGAAAAGAARRSMAFASLPSWAASTPPSTWRCGTGISPARPPRPIWRSCCPALRAKSAADVLALTQQPQHWQDI